MKKVLSILSIIVALSVLFTITSFAFTFELYDDVMELMGEPTKDAPSSWAVEFIDRANAQNLVPAYLDIGYRQTMTRAEYCALAVRLYESLTKAEIKERMKFVDTDDTNVEKMGALGIVTGVGNDRFAPNDLLTREQAATMLARLAAVLNNPLPEIAATFNDNSRISSWAIIQVGQVQAAGIMSGVGNNTFDPKGSYSREQSIITMIRLFDFV